MNGEDYERMQNEVPNYLKLGSYDCLGLLKAQMAQSSPPSKATVLGDEDYLVSTDSKRN